MIGRLSLRMASKCPHVTKRVSLFTPLGYEKRVTLIRPLPILSLTLFFLSTATAAAPVPTRKAPTVGS